MKQISKTDQARIAEAHANLEELRGKVEDYLAEVQVKLDELQAAAEEAREAAHAIVDDLANEASSYYDERSEKWQDGDVGQQYQEWVRELEEAASILDESVVLNVEQGVEMSSFDNLLGALDGSFRNAPDE